ncbi:nucleoside deaminase [Bradyrhizobium sp. LHD-71]|uniref:nucleoside deaminase n=1 Tax=Bradyrhizobium sp. LHD-71 TaxID=3072141 RepID=UPI00280EDA71|nr:nucleoside deaminase [Bradyrhizobium sp. LHD-71]MDQ8732101.1 nucleoside deaminase [Bradyrhizobium sp. LHD-71]
MPEAAKEPAMYEDKFMQRALALSALALSKPGTEPFGALVVRNGEIVGEGVNHSKANHDPTSHGETEAIRDACRRLECVDLSGCDLYSSCEPCAMCVATMAIAGISKLYYAAGMDAAGAVIGDLPVSKRHPIDVEFVRSEAGKLIQDRQQPAEQHRSDEAVSILESWATN